MAEPFVLLDTNVFIHLTRGHDKAERFRPYIERSRIVLSFVTVAELRLGAHVRGYNDESKRHLESSYGRRPSRDARFRRATEEADPERSALPELVDRRRDCGGRQTTFASVRAAQGRSGRHTVGAGDASSPKHSHASSRIRS